MIQTILISVGLAFITIAAFAALPVLWLLWNTHWANWWMVRWLAVKRWWRG